MKSKKKSWLVLIVVVLMIAAWVMYLHTDMARIISVQPKTLSLVLTLQVVSTSPTKQTKTIHPLKI